MICRLLLLRLSAKGCGGGGVKGGFGYLVITVYDESGWRWGVWVMLCRDLGHQCGAE